MFFLSRWSWLCRLGDSGCQATKFSQDVIELVAHRCALFLIHPTQFGVSPQETSVGTTDNRGHDFQIARQFLH
jgi:hypothetical protein